MSSRATAWAEGLTLAAGVVLTMAVLDGIVAAETPAPAEAIGVAGPVEPTDAIVPGDTTAARRQALADAAPRDAYAGAAACRRCHVAEYEQWAASRPSRMMRPAEPAEISAAFTPGASLTYRGRTFSFERSGGDFVIVESDGGRLIRRHRVEYVLGSRRIQHFLTRRPDGALVLLPPTWDVVRETWFPQAEIVPTGDPEVEPVQVWDKHCFGCHVSQQRKNFDVEALTYDGDWLDAGTSCETCHGAARWHVEYFDAVARGETPAAPPAGVAGKRPLLPFAGQASVELCATCHQNRYLMQPGHVPGEPFFDYFLTALPYTIAADDPDPGYFVDGRTRRFSNNSFALWTSSCYLDGGVRCLDCHRSGHAVDIEDNPQLQPQAAATELCASCHAGLVAEAAAHGRHPVAAASCLDCHMPRTVSGIKATMRDHSLAVPVPLNTRDHAVPNACNQCHSERSAQWAEEHIAAWFGQIEARPRALKLRRRARAFAAATVAAPTGLEPLLEILRDPDEPFLMRATAAGYLRAYPDAGALEGLWDALVDPHELVRAVAILSVGAHPRGRELVHELLPALTDPSYSVRVNTAFALATLGVGEAGGALERPLRAAQDEYLEHLALYADSAADQANRGALLALRGELDAALVAYRTALRLQPGHPDVRFGLARVLVQMGARDEALEELERLRRQEPEYPGLADLLDRIAGDRR